MIQGGVMWTHEKSKLQKQQKKSTLTHN